MMKTLALTWILTIFSANSAFAQIHAPAPAPALPSSVTEMHCLVGLLKGADVEHEDQASNSTVLLSLPIVDGEGDKEFTVAGETVSFSVDKREYVDLYDTYILLLTPVADRPARGPARVAIIADYLINAGPAKNNGWTIKPGPNSTKYEFLNRRSGTISITQKFQKALAAAGKWGQHPFTAYQMDVQYSYELAEAARELLAAGKIAKTDVLAIYSVFGCTLTK